MLNPIDPTSSNEYHNFNVPQDSHVVINLYKEADKLVLSLDDSNTDHKNLSNWFRQKIIPHFRNAHDVIDNDELREELEEFIDHVQNVLKKG